MTPDSGSSPIEDSWSLLSDGLLAGLHHSLNNRLASLAAIAQVLETDLPPHHPLAEMLTSEFHRFEAVVSTLRLLGSGTGRPEPVEVRVAIEEARRLVQLHHALRDVELEDEVSERLLPVHCSPARLLRAVCVALAIVGRHALTGERKARIVATGDESYVTLTVEGRGSEGEPGNHERLKGLSPGWIELALEGSEVGVERDEDVLRIAIRLPTLLEVRRRETPAPR
jgi:hypothetical protein